MRFTVLIAALMLTALSYSQNKLQSTDSFQDGLETWQYGTWASETDEPGGFISAESTGKDAFGGSARIQVDKTTANPNKIFLRSLGVQLEEGKRYRLSFWVKTDAKDSSINVMLYSDFYTGSFNTWGGILSKTLSLQNNNTWENLEIEFEAKSAYKNSPVDFDAIALSFGFAKHKGTYYLDQVSIEAL
ncbi:carbohydrate binding domain-containing protein [Algibacter sp. 2305UL17-15]|uniref:carbohydrate binding domain-containing protein n=1 Tax=Algibacter sp. 2305UL17-15 TaxID=3231268 RepID=UPI00345861D8